MHSKFPRNPVTPPPCKINTLCYRSTPEHRNRHLQDEVTYRLLKLLESEPHLSQREIARRMGISLGKTNYCIKSLIEKGFIKARNFCRASQKTPYMYYLTPSGFEEKARVTYRFLKRKMQEYEEIKQEIERLKVEAESLAHELTPED